MKHRVLLSMLLALGCVHVHGAPTEQNAMEPGSCKDAQALVAADLALAEINQDREEGYVFALHGLSNFYMASHGENGQVFYLTLDVVETTCSVLSKKGYKECEVRDTTDTPVYGQCKVVIHINRVQRIVRLYNYNCVVRPVPGARLHALCPDCPSLISQDYAMVQKTVSSSLEKFNKESRLSNHFVLLKINRALTGMAVGMYYIVEFTIQETTCAEGAEKCPLMDREFAHKGYCEGIQYPSPFGDIVVDVQCDIYKPEHADGKHNHISGLDRYFEHGHLHHNNHHDEKTSAHEPEGKWTVLPAMDQPTTPPSFPDMPAADGPQGGSNFPPFPTAVSAECAPTPPGQWSTLVEKLFAEDPLFRPAAN